MLFRKIPHFPHALSSLKIHCDSYRWSFCRLRPHLFRHPQKCALARDRLQLSSGLSLHTRFDLFRMKPSIPIELENFRIPNAVSRESSPHHTLLDIPNNWSEWSTFSIRADLLDRTKVGVAFYGTKILLLFHIYLTVPFFFSHILQFIHTVFQHISRHNVCLNTFSHGRLTLVPWVLLKAVDFLHFALLLAVKNLQFLPSSPVIAILFKFSLFTNIIGWNFCQTNHYP